MSTISQLKLMINSYLCVQDEDETQAEKSVRIVNDHALSI